MTNALSRCGTSTRLLCMYLVAATCRLGCGATTCYSSSITCDSACTYSTGCDLSMFSTGPCYGQSGSWYCPSNSSPPPLPPPSSNPTPSGSSSYYSNSVTTSTNVNSSSSSSTSSAAVVVGVVVGVIGGLALILCLVCFYRRRRSTPAPTLPLAASYVQEFNVTPRYDYMQSSMAPASSFTMNPLAQGGLSRAPSLPMVPPLRDGEYHFFLSHYRVNAGQNCNILKLALEKAGYSAWFDNGARVLPTVNGMREGVAKSHTFLLYLSREVFTRQFVLIEIQHAILLGKKIILVMEENTQRKFQSQVDGTMKPYACSMEEFKKQMPPQLAGPLFKHTSYIPYREHETEQEAMVKRITGAYETACSIPKNEVGDFLDLNLEVDEIANGFIATFKHGV